MLKNTPLQHGENVLVPIKALPAGEFKESKMVIVGHSETGHHHVLTSTENVKVVEFEDRMYVEVMLDSLLTHKKTDQKHDTLTVKKGSYEVVHKTEYNPIIKVIARVFD